MENFKVLQRSKCLVVAYEDSEIIFNCYKANIATASFKGKCIAIEIPCNYGKWWEAIKELGVDISHEKSAQFMNWLV